MINSKRPVSSFYRFLLMLLISVPNLHLSAEELQLYTEEWPPLNFTRDNQLTGYSVELVQALSQLTGDPVRIESVPWTRGYGLAQQQANTGLFSVGRIAERESKITEQTATIGQHTMPTHTATELLPCARS